MNEANKAYQTAAMLRGFDPRSEKYYVISARFAGRCLLCGGGVMPGTRCRFYPGRKGVAHSPYCPETPAPLPPRPAPRPAASVMVTHESLLHAAEALEADLQVAIAAGADPSTLETQRDAAWALRTQAGELTRRLGDPQRGDVVEVVGGRKLALGLTGPVTWVGDSKYGRRVGFRTADGVQFTAIGNVRVVAVRRERGDEDTAGDAMVAMPALEPVPVAAPVADPAEDARERYKDALAEHNEDPEDPESIYEARLARGME